MTIKGCRSFVGMVNFVSIFCPELKKLLKPITDLTRKGRQFIWEQKQQSVFDEIKNRFHLISSLMKLRTDCKKPQYYIYQTRREDFICTKTLANLPQAVYCTRFKMVSQNLLPMLAKDCLKQPEIIQLQNLRCVV